MVRGRKMRCGVKVVIGLFGLVGAQALAVSLDDYEQFEESNLAGSILVREMGARPIEIKATTNGTLSPSFAARRIGDDVLLEFAPKTTQDVTQLNVAILDNGSVLANRSWRVITAEPEVREPSVTPESIEITATKTASQEDRECSTQLVIERGRLLSQILEGYLADCGKTLVWNVAKKERRLDHEMQEAMVLPLAEGLTTLSESLLQWYGIQSRIIKNQVVFAHQ